MSAGIRHNGSSKLGSSVRMAPGHRGSSGHRHRTIPAGHRHDAYAPYDQGEPCERTTAWDADTAYYDSAAYDEDARYDEGASYAATVAWDADLAHDVDAADDGPEPERPSLDAGRAGRASRYAGRHASSRRKTARIRARQAVPAAVVAAAFAAGAAAYTLVGTGHPQAARLNDAMSAALILSTAAHAGRADTAASAMIQASTAPGTVRPSATAGRTASPKSSASRTAAAKSAVLPTATASAAAAPPAAPPAASASSPPAASTLSCNLSYGLLPDNVTTIVSFLLANGYTDNAAAGIAGNIYQESKGDPESIGMGGGGLIGWTPLPSGFVTGDLAADLQTQLAAILTYNQQWASYLPALNSAASPSDAAYIYVTYFERAGIPAAATREAAAENVAGACGI